MKRPPKKAPTPSGVYGCKCEKCGVIFPAVTKRARFCSDACRNLFNYRRRRSHERARIAMEERINDPWWHVSGRGEP